MTRSPAAVVRVEPTGIDGVVSYPLAMHADDRGCLTEILRHSWPGVPALVQWNYLRSAGGVLRGMHAHVKHTDYVVLVEGTLIVALKDLRRGSPTHLRSTLVALDADALRALVIPPGVAHGFYSARQAGVVQAVTDYWHPSDELGCRWDDPDLGIAWPCVSPVLSAKDAALPSYAAFLLEMDARLDHSSPASLRT